MKIQLIPKTKRLKQRVKQHGDIFEVVKFKPKEHKYLIKSLEKTAWNNQHWLCWISETEADLITV